MKKDEMTNREYIENLFAQDDIKAPGSLSEESIMELISKEDTKAANVDSKAVYQKKRTRALPLKWALVAACAILLVFCLPSLYYSKLFLPDTSEENGRLHEFSSRSEIVHLLKSINRTDPWDRFRMGRDTVEYASEDAGMGAGIESETSSMNASSSTASKGMTASEGDHSKTYLQEADVDEADIVKVDGRYIYAVNNKQEIIIYEASEGQTKKMSTIGNNGVENYIEDIFLKGDTLVTIGHVYTDDGDRFAAVVTYDVSDRSKPRLIDQFRQSGDNIVSSRMVGDYVYLVSELSVYAYSHEWKIPLCTIDGEIKEIAYNDISCVPNPNASSYIILSAVNISSGDLGKSKTKAVLGQADEIYCNNHNLYVAVSEWDEGSMETNTRIIKATLDGTEIKFNMTTSIKGYINNQFSMDEHDGYFRVATTSRRNGLDVNNLYVLDDKLSELGKVVGFARDESIKAVRFMGDKAYVITYEAIDPLFVMDLSDPSNPTIEGEVMIDGFSSMLIPAGDGRILGIGHATGDNGYGGQFDSGLKLALFDVSDSLQPKVLDSIEFEYMESPAQYTHLALTLNENAGYYAIPYNILDENEAGVLVFGLSGEKKDKIEIYDQHNIDAAQIQRSVYIKDYIYAINTRAEVYGFKFDKDINKDF